MPRCGLCRPVVFFLNQNYNFRGTKGQKYLMRDKTVMVIAHRLSTLSHLDRILVFQQGEIVEDGSHNQLLQREGHYAKMWSMQAGGFLPQSEL